MAKVTDKQKEEILKRVRNGESVESIADEFGISKGYVYLLTSADKKESASAEKVNQKVKPLDDKVKQVYVKVKAMEDKTADDKIKSNDDNESNLVNQLIQKIEHKDKDLDIMFKLYGQRTLELEKIRLGL